MTEDVFIGGSKYILDWNNGYVMIIDLDLSKYLRFFIDDVDKNINILLKDLLFKEVIKSALKDNYDDWKSLKDNNNKIPQENSQIEVKSPSQGLFTF